VSGRSLIPIRSVVALFETCSGVRSQLECVVGTLDDTSTPDLRPSRPIGDSGALRAPATAIAAVQRRWYQM
jgi:hypothetical protein